MPQPPTDGRTRPHTATRPTDTGTPAHRLDGRTRPGERTLPAALVLAICVAAVAYGLVGLTRPAGPEDRCRINLYDDGTAALYCQPGYQPHQPADRWPVVRVEV